MILQRSFLINGLRGKIKIPISVTEFFEVAKTGNSAAGRPAVCGSVGSARRRLARPYRPRNEVLPQTVAALSAPCRSDGSFGPCPIQAGLLGARPIGHILSPRGHCSPSRVFRLGTNRVAHAGATLNPHRPIELDLELRRPFS